MSRGGGRSQRPVQLGPVALVDAGDVAVVRHSEVLELQAVRMFIQNWENNLPRGSRIRCSYSDQQPEIFYLSLEHNH